MPRTLFKNAAVIDGNGNLLEKCYILVEGDSFSVVDQRYNEEHARDALEVDLAGKYLMPGLINCHVHVFSDPFVADSLVNSVHQHMAKTTVLMMKNMDTMLKSGTTYFRDCGCAHNLAIELRNMVREGTIVGPESLACGNPIVMTGGHGYSFGYECDEVAGVMQGTRYQLKQGADFIKIMTTGGYSTRGVRPNDLQFTRRELCAAVEVAKNAHKKTATHVMGIAGIENAVEAGIDTLEHCEFFNDDDPRRIDAVVQKMLDKGIAAVPTLLCTFSKFTNANGYLKIPTDDFLHTQIIRQWRFADDPSHGPAEWYCPNDVLEGFKILHKAGVKLAAGNDGGLSDFPFDRLPFELKLMILAGMTPMEAIMSATRNAAEVLGVNKLYGTIEPGKKADFLILPENPLENIDALYNIDAVYKLGKKYTPGCIFQD